MNNPGIKNTPVGEQGELVGPSGSEAPMDERTLAGEQSGPQAAGAATSQQHTWDNPTDTVDDGVTQTVEGREYTADIAGSGATRDHQAGPRDEKGVEADDDDLLGVLTTGGTGGTTPEAGDEGTFGGAGRSYGDADTLKTNGD